MKRTKLGFAIVLIFISIASCKKSTTTQSLFLNISGLEDLGTNFRYEGWIIVGGNAVSTGIFSVNNTGVLSHTSFTVDKTQLAAATDFVLTIEPFPDIDPAPTATHILAGSFASNTASITIADPKALGTSFASATGKYILATPTDGSGTNEKSGIWFLSLATGSPTVGLSLPTLPSGWIYEGWAVIGGVPVTSGKFTSTTAADLSAPFSGSVAPGPPFPGEDFLKNAPAGVIFPTDLSGGKAVISIEPVPDNSPMPFLLKPLLGSIPSPAADHVTYNMALNIAGVPVGTVTR